jgi:hypothetical protein
MQKELCPLCGTCGSTFPAACAPPIVTNCHGASDSPSKPRFSAGLPAHKIFVVFQATKSVPSRSSRFHIRIGRSFCVRPTRCCHAAMVTPIWAPVEHAPGSDSYHALSADNLQRPRENTAVHSISKKGTTGQEEVHARVRGPRQDDALCRCFRRQSPRNALAP